MTTDFILVGQGISGTFLSWYLYKAGFKVLVIDEPLTSTATRVASGVINPVTGRQVVTTWMAETLMPFTWQAYKAIGSDIGVDVINQRNIVVFPPSQQMRDAYDKRIGQANSYIKPVSAGDAAAYNQQFYSFFGSAEIGPVWLVDLHPLLNGWRNKLKQEGLLLEEPFDAAQLHIQTHHVTYKTLRAQKLFFCNGINAFTLPYFNRLPYVFNKGEALIASIPGLAANRIYKVGSASLVPWYNGLWWVGSSYENTYPHALPTPQYRHKKIQELQMHCKLPFTIVDHLASLRPAVAVERRPFVGLHPAMPAIGMLNGMGSKGCSLASYFAQQLTQHLLQGTPIDPLADLKRFSRMIKPI